MSEQQDNFDLNRFVNAQEGVYSRALEEVRAGRKQSHWMWFVFPQISGLGFSAMSQRYAIKNREEAVAYLQHPVLGARLIECMQVVLAVEGYTAHDIFGVPDDMKLLSCATLFANISPTDPVFQKVIAKYFNGEANSKTLRLLRD